MVHSLAGGGAPPADLNLAAVSGRAH